MWTHIVSLSAGECACVRLNVETHSVCVCRRMCVCEIECGHTVSVSAGECACVRLNVETQCLCLQGNVRV